MQENTKIKSTPACPGGMVTITKEIYGIEGNLTALDIRHKWAGLLNIVFPKDTGLATTLTANNVAVFL